ISLPMAHLGLNVFPNLVSFSLTIFPILDALIVIFGVRSYRRALLSFLMPNRVHDSTQRLSLTIQASNITNIGTSSNHALHRGSW
ncbi:hypothetical protein PENTCL1PPCAC_16001, partial [Pristionchus entomophagus]